MEQLEGAQDRKLKALTEQVKTFSTRVGYDTEPAADTPAVNVDPETGEVIEPLA